MAEAATMNGAAELTPEQYKTMCKQVMQYQKSKIRGKKKSKGLLKPIGDINKVTKTFFIQKSPVDWDDIKNGMPFSLDSEGTLLYTKTNKERAICLNTMSPVPVGGASVYRVFL